MRQPTIALLTDFGLADFFVASMKGTILSINPFAKIVDLSHDVRSFDIRVGGFLLFGCYRFFPAETIFLAVVDPRVGSARRLLLAETERYFFIAPDNGILAQALENESIKSLRELRNEKFFLTSERTTFEGRDRMAPAAAWLSLGIPLDEFGPELNDYQKLGFPKPVFGETEAAGVVVFQDKFGNLVTNLPGHLVDIFREKHASRPVVLVAGKQEISHFRKTYAAAQKGEIFAIAGSIGSLEIALREGDASKKLNLKPGDEVRIIVKTKT
jgi:hypothetical protein